MNLDSIYLKFPNQEDCYNYLEEILWNKIPICPYCNSKNSTVLKNSKRYHCNNCNTSYSVTVNTIFHKTKIDLQKWFYLIIIFYSIENLNSLRNISLKINVTKDTVFKIIGKLKRHTIKQDENLKIISQNLLLQERLFLSDCDN